MDAVLTCRLPSGKNISLCPYGFKWADLSGAQILSGDDYYIKKAVLKGAKKPVRKKAGK